MILNLSNTKVEEQREKIRRIRVTKEIEPVEVGVLLVDADPASIDRMESALNIWSILGQATIDWTMADNSVVPLTEVELIALLDNVKIARGVRGAQLHQYASTLKAGMPYPDDAIVFDGSTWPSY